MKKLFASAFLLAIFGFSNLAAAAWYDKGQPLFFQGWKVEKDREEMLRGFGLVLKDEPQMSEKMVVERGLKMVLQSPSYGYEQGKDFFLFLRFKAVDGRHPVRFNMLGSFDIEVTDMTRAEVRTGTYVFDDDYKNRVIKEGGKAVSLGISEESVPEINVIFNLGDFNFVPPADGVYRIKITYHSESPDNSVWTGALASNPILIEVGQTR